MEGALPNITISCSSEYQDYTYNEKHDIWALVSLIAPCQDEESTKKRAAMDIVAVIDKSGSMAGEKLKLVKRTLEFVLTQLDDKDRLALITYDTDVYVDFGLMNMSKGNKVSASTKINKIDDGSCTNLCGGLMKGLCQIINRPAGKKNDVASVLLFTDGLANSGIQSVEGIIAAMKDPKSYDGPTGDPQPLVVHRDNPQAPAPHTSWLKNIFSGSPKKSAQVPVEVNVDAHRTAESNDSPTSSSTAGDATVYTFGFGHDHNADMLKKISDAGNGMYYFIETEDKIGESFAHCLGGLMSTVAQGIQLEVTMQTGATIKDVHTSRPCEKKGGESIKVNIGDLQSEENRDIVLELTIDPVNAPYDTTPQVVFNSKVDYFNVISNNLMSASESLAILRPATTNVHDESNVNARLTKEKCRVDMTRAMKEAGDKAAAGDYEGTNVLLTKRIKSMKQHKQTLMAKQDVDLAWQDEYDAMVDDLEECQGNSISASVWESKGQRKQTNMLQQYECQRSAMPDSKAFKSKAKKSAVSKSKAFFK